MKIEVNNIIRWAWRKPSGRVIVSYLKPVESISVPGTYLNSPYYGYLSDSLREELDLFLPSDHLKSLHQVRADGKLIPYVEECVYRVKGLDRLLRVLREEGYKPYHSCWENKAENKRMGNGVFSLCGKKVNKDQRESIQSSFLTKELKGVHGPCESM